MQLTTPIAIESPIELNIQTITSNDILSDIDNHFKICAGPGAGKTYWLVNHIKNVLHKSNRLFRTKKVACITYTNIATETILKRLGTESSQVEVSTIHSFLYRNIVKPYASFIANEYELNIAKMDGHDEIIISDGKIVKWARETNQIYLIQDNDKAIEEEKQNKVVKALENIQWILNNNIIELSYKKTYLSKISAKTSIKKNSLILFKKSYWKNGIISHDDVIFFSYQILKKFPFVIDVLNAKFPYIFIDEFQDSNPIQVEIVKALGNKKSIIGIIGDIAQSIYGFQGANYNLFKSFTLPSLKEYILEENRRSSNEIINILNHIRTDIQQKKVRNTNIAKPKIFVGDMILALKQAKKDCNNEDVYTLSRNNITSNAIKAQINDNGLDSKLLDTYRHVDNNSERRNLIYNCIKALAYAKEKKFADAIRKLEKHFDDKVHGKKKALEYIIMLLNKYEELKDSPLIKFADCITILYNSKVNKNTNGNKPKIATFRAGTIKDFYEKYTLNQLILCVSIPEDISLHKTIHKSKGDEFDNVLLILNNKEDLEFCLNPDLLSDKKHGEEHRLYYVACSRAKNRLFISVPKLENKRERLSNLFDIQDLT